MAKTILSVCDFELKAVRNYSLDGVSGFSHKFVLTANERGKFSTCGVHDMFDRFHAGDNNYASVPERAQNIADDVLGEWTRNSTMPSPGVLICKGDEPTPEEVAEAERMHAKHCEHKRALANQLWAEDKRSQATDPIYRKASLWLGYGNDPWVLNPTKPVEQKSCQFCKSSIPADAAVCSHCGQIADFDAYAQLELKKTAVMQKVQAQVAKQQTAAQVRA